MAVRHDDPWQRRLRAAAAIVFIATFVYLALRATLGEPVEFTTLALLVGSDLGSLLVLLGYERIVNLPFIRKDDDKGDR